MAELERRLEKEKYIGKNKHISVNKRYAQRFPLHAHDYFEVEIVLEGDGIQYVNGNENALQRGSVTVLSPSDFHEVNAKNDTTLMVWNIAFDDSVISLERLESIFSSGGMHRVLSEKDLLKVDSAISLLEQDCEDISAIKLLMEYLLLILLQKKSGNKQLSPISKAVLYIETHFRENPSLNDVANHVCLSPVYFGNLFKSSKGEKYVDYVNRRKVKCATMLLESGFSVAEACYNSGFGSLSGFLYTFKKIKGISPNEYKQNKKSQEV